MCVFPLVNGWRRLLSENRQEERLRRDVACQRINDRTAAIGRDDDDFGFDRIALELPLLASAPLARIATSFKVSAA
jgi:hypothetical protein